jgi:hypothetical protein
LSGSGGVVRGARIVEALSVEAVHGRNWRLLLLIPPPQLLLHRGGCEGAGVPLLNLPEQALDRVLEELSPVSLAAGRFV